MFVLIRVRDSWMQKRMRLRLKGSIIFLSLTLTVIWLDHLLEENTSVRNYRKLFQLRLSNLLIESDKENPQLTSIIFKRSLNNLEASGGQFTSRDNLHWTLHLSCRQLINTVYADCVFPYNYKILKSWRCSQKQRYPAKHTVHAVVCIWAASCHPLWCVLLSVSQGLQAYFQRSLGVKEVLQLLKMLLRKQRLQHLHGWFWLKSTKCFNSYQYEHQHQSQPLWWPV